MTEAERIEQKIWAEWERGYKLAKQERLQQLIKLLNEEKNKLNFNLFSVNSELGSKESELKSAQELNRELVKGVDEIRDFMQRNIPSVESGVWPQWLDCRDKLEALLNKAK